MQIISQRRVLIRRIGYDLVQFMREILASRNDGYEKHVWSIGLNGKNETLYIDQISIAAANEITVNPRRVLGLAIARSAQSVVLVQHRAFERPEASQIDVRITRRLSRGGSLLGVNVLDHIIMNETYFRSFRDLGLSESLYISKIPKPVKK